jgi:hypothetical protein
MRVRALLLASALAGGIWALPAGAAAAPPLAEVAGAAADLAVAAEQIQYRDQYWGGWAPPPRYHPGPPPPRRYRYIAPRYCCQPAPRYRQPVRRWTPPPVYRRPSPWVWGPQEYRY